MLDETQAKPTILPRRRTWLILAGVVVLGVLLRGARLSEAPGGFHVFNEGFYVDLAMRMAQQPSPFAWFLHPLDVNNPPLYPVLVSWLYRLGAPHVAGARVISVIAAAWSVTVTFLLGRLLYDDRAGLVAAAVLAVMPGAALVEHNIQVDPLFVALLLTGAYLYVLSARTGSTASALFGGAALGLAFLTKQPAVLLLFLLAVWETWCAHDIRWLKKARGWWFAAGFVVVGLPWYLAQVGMGSIGAMFANANVIHGNSPLDGEFWGHTFFSEIAWMLFPPAGLLWAAGLVWLGWQRKAGDKLLIVLTVGYLGWYIVFHQHSYYLLPLAPVFSLTVGRVCAGPLAEKIPWPRVRPWLVVALATAMVFASLLMLGGQKWGRWSPMSYDLQPDPGFDQVRLYYDPMIDGIFGPSTSHMPGRLMATPVTTQEFINAPAAAGVESRLLSVLYTDAQGRTIPPFKAVTEMWLRPVVFGYAIGQTTLEDSNGMRLHAAQAFTNAPWTAEKVAPWWHFGFQSSPVESGLYLYKKASLGGPNTE